MKLFSRQIAVDFGTANIRIFVKGKGLVVDEPSIAAIELGDRKHRLLAAGIDAKKMIGKAPERIQTIRPVRQGVVSEFDVFAAMLQYFLKNAVSRRSLIKPDLVFTVPGQITAVEKRALVEAAEWIGAHEVRLIPNCVAASLGAGLPIQKPQCSMIVDLGAGKTEIAAVSLTDIVVRRSVPVSGDLMDFALLQHLKSSHGIVVGQATAEEVKIRAGKPYAAASSHRSAMEIKGRDLQTGTPTTVRVDESEMWKVIAAKIDAILLELRAALEKMPPELASDIIDNGLLLSGGVASMRGLDRLISREIGVPVIVAEKPLTAAILGAGQILENGGLLEKISMA